MPIQMECWYSPSFVFCFHLILFKEFFSATVHKIERNMLLADGYRAFFLL